MKKLLLSALALGLATFANAQTWVQQVAATNQALYSIHFTNVQNGWACGTNGASVKTTTDGGLTWGTQATPALNSVDLNDVFFVSSTNGYIVGTGGTILRTTNAGATWSLATTPNTNILYSVHFFVGGNVGFACGYNTLLKTTDGGVNWISITNSNFTNQTLNDVQMVGTNTVLVLRNNKVVTSNDGGTSWTATNITGAAHYKISMTSPTDGFVVGQGIGLLTNNSAISFTNSTPSTSDTYFGLDFYDAMNGYAVGGPTSGSGGRIYKTTNGGVSWTQDLSITGSGAGFNAVHALDANNAWAVTSDGRIFKINTATAINEKQNTINNINIYPNPAKNVLNIELAIENNETLIEVSNALGQIVLTQKLNNNKNVIDIANLTTGIYFIKANNTTKKFIKE